MSMQEAILNTIVKIKSCTRASASGKNAYNLERTKNRDKDILVLEKNEMPKEKVTNTKEQKKEMKSLQTKLSTYKKRLEKAIKDGKEKSIKTNQKNINKITKQLSKIEKADGREKYFTEFTVALTNSKKGEYVENWSELSLEYLKKEFPTLQVVSAVEHRDQHSPHMHILLYSDDKPVTEVLADKRLMGGVGAKDTSREAMKDAYSRIQHSFHSFAKRKIAHNGLEKLHKGRKYVSLGQYKQKGNFEAKKAFKGSKESLVLLNKELTSTKATLRDSHYLTAQPLNEHNIPLYSDKKMFRTLHFITSDHIKYQKKELDATIDRVGIALKADVTAPKKKIDEFWKELEENSEPIKKEDARKINPEYLKTWKEDLNKYLKEFNAQVQKVLDSLKKKKVSIEAKIAKHPQTLQQQELIKQKDKERQEQRALKKDKPQGQGL